MENEKRIAELMEELESIKEELHQLKGKDGEDPEGAEVAETLSDGGEKSPVCLQVIDWLGKSTVADLRRLADDDDIDDEDVEKLNALADKAEDDFAQIPHHYYAEVYKGLRKNLEFGLYENEAAFLEAVQEEGLESFAIEDGFDFENPSREILPQYAEVHKPRTLEDQTFHAGMDESQITGMMIGDRICGPLGSVIGYGIGSLFAPFVGLARLAEIKWIGRG